MPEPQLHRSSQSNLPFDESLDSTYNDYSIRRKGSRYNIIGPMGRIFDKYKSASVVGPRWEELTHTLWPYQSSAYQPGTRLWQLGLIESSELDDKFAVLEQSNPVVVPTSRTRPSVKKTISSVVGSKKNDSEQEVIPFIPSPPARPAGLSPHDDPDERLPLTLDQDAIESEAQVEGRDLRRDNHENTVKTNGPVHGVPTEYALEGVAIAPIPSLVLALPAPRIDLAEQARLIAALRRDPSLLFDSRVRQALAHEVEYHRPSSRWAQHLLKLLSKYDRRQERARAATRRSDTQTIMVKHIAWQEQQTRMPAMH